MPLPIGDDDAAWEPIETAPTTGRVLWVDVWNGADIIRAHYAYGGGEEQPPFGPAWFRAVRSKPTLDSQRGEVSYYSELYPQPTHWRRGSERPEE